MRNIKFKTIEAFILLLIVAFAAFFYTYRLGSNPPGVYLDEVGTGYNAYSILKTGMDEYGKAFPLAFRLFGSYTPPLYIYFTVPIMTLLGLNIFSTRLLSVICGVSAIIVFFFLVKELNFAKSKYTAVFSTLFFAITPWLIFFSRMGYEQNLAFLFFCISALMIVKTVKNPNLSLVTIPLISLATYSDYPMRIVAPLLFLGSAIIFWKKITIKVSLKPILIGIIVASLIQIPNLFLLTTPSSYTKTEHFYSNAISSQANKIENFLPPVVALPLSFTREFFSQYFTYFSPRSLFFLPDDDPQRSMPELSVFYFWMIVPYLTGLYFLYRNRKNIYSKYIFLLLIITPIPGAIAGQPFHIQRTLPLLLPLSLIISIGVDRVISNSKIKVWLPASVFLFLISLILFWRSYFVLLPSLRATVWGFQWSRLSEYIKSHPDQTFVIDQSARTKPQDIAYEQIAFYLKTDPKIVQADQDPAIAKRYYYNTSFNLVHKFGNVETKAINWGEATSKNIVFVGDTGAISDLEVRLHSLTQVFEIDDPNTAVIVLRGFVAGAEKQQSKPIVIKD